MNNTNTIQEIINHELIEIYMQTILSHHDEFAMGVEAFVKGIDPVDGHEISPLELFQLADDCSKSVELDLLIMKKVIESYLPIKAEKDDTLLFVNISECLIIENDTEKDIMALVRDSGLHPSSIVFDIGDYPNATVNQILSFIDRYRDLGFYISIDDIGKNYFNLDRIIIYNPDIIKINNQYLSKLNHTEYTNRVLNHIGRIAHEMGMIVVETGIESDEELKMAYDQGAQYFQGYYLRKPMKVSPANIRDFLSLEETIIRMKKYRREAVIEEMRPFMNKMVMFLNEIRRESTTWLKEDLDAQMNKLFRAHPSIENGWLLNLRGVQISKAMINNEGFSKRNASIFNIFNEGHDYSTFDFFRLLSSGALEVWITKPYRSLLTNSICVTTSSYLELEGEDPIIVCLVFNFEMFKTSHM